MGGCETSESLVRAYTACSVVAQSMVSDIEGQKLPFSFFLFCRD